MPVSGSVASGQRLSYWDLEEGQSLIEYEELGLQLIVSLNTDREKLLENVRHNIKRPGLGRIWPHKPNETTLAIVAGGPSLNDTEDELRRVVAGGAQVVALANTTHWLVDRGIYPTAQVILDAKPRNAEFVRNVEGCHYFIASQCDPSVFDTVLGYGDPSHRVFIFHAVNNDEEFMAIQGQDEPWVPVHAGSTITMRAVRMFSILGYGKYHLFGFDSCMMGDRHHAYEQQSADHFRVAEIMCNDRAFRVTGWMVNQAMEFIKFAKMFGQGIDIVVHGDGLIAHMIRSGAERMRQKQQEAAA